MPPSSSFCSAVRPIKAEFLPIVGCQLKYGAVALPLLVNARVLRGFFGSDLRRVAGGIVSSNLVSCCGALSILSGWGMLRSFDLF